MGSSLAARRAGQRPKNSPTTALKPKATPPRVGRDQRVPVHHPGEQRSRRRRRAGPRARRPARQSTSASTRNWSRMLHRVAPSALRTPISRVRSVTETSMMFMMPMPPTRRLTAAMLASSVVKIWVVCCWVARMSCWLRIVEVVLAAGPDLVLPPEHPLDVDHALLDRHAVRHLHRDRAQPVGAEDPVRAVWSGIRICSSGLPEAARRRPSRSGPR